MLISLNVVSIAAVFCASFRRSAMRWRRRVIWTRRSLRSGAQGGQGGQAAVSMARCRGRSAESGRRFGRARRRRRRRLQVARRAGRLRFVRDFAGFCRRSCRVDSCFCCFNPRQHIAGFHFAARRQADFLEHAGNRCGDFQDDLVGFQIGERFIALHKIARLFAPIQQRAALHGLGKLRGFDIDEHGSPAFVHCNSADYRKEGTPARD